MDFVPFFDAVFADVSPTDVSKAPFLNFEMRIVSVIPTRALAEAVCEGECRKTHN